MTDGDYYDAMDAWRDDFEDQWHHRADEVAREFAQVDGFDWDALSGGERENYLRAAGEQLHTEGWRPHRC